MANKFGLIVFLVYLFVALYFINYPFNFLKIPEFVSNFETWIIFFGGLLIILGGINFLRASRMAKLNAPY